MRSAGRLDAIEFMRCDGVLDSQGQIDRGTTRADYDWEDADDLEDLEEEGEEQSPYLSEVSRCRAYAATCRELSLSAKSRLRFRIEWSMTGSILC